MNNIDYHFTKEEVEAVSKLLYFARTSGDEEIQEIAQIVAVAFNREAFNKIGWEFPAE